MNINENLSTEIVYPPEIKRYDSSNQPKVQPNWITFLAWFASSLFLSFLRKGYKVEKTNMKGLKPPYILLINHLQPLDFCFMYKMFFPHKVSTVASYHTYTGVSDLMEKLGCIITRKHIADIGLVRACKKVLQEQKGIFCMFPEAGYSPIGTLGILPDSLGKLVKKSGVPVVVMLQRGNYLNLPFWTNSKHRKTPVKIELKQILTPEELESKSVDEINEIIRKEMDYNEYAWQKENNICIKAKDRAQGLHKVLYQCPHCMTESKMNSDGIHLFCEECGKKWEMTELGEMKALNGETEFSHIPDWFNWQRENVRKEVLNGEYSFEDEAEIYSLPGVESFVNLGKANLTHSLEDGFVITGSFNEHPYRVQRLPKGHYDLHVEYEFERLQGPDCISFSTKNDTFFCIPSKKDVVTKLTLATEEIYKILNDSKETVNA